MASLSRPALVPPEAASAAEWRRRLQPASSALGLYATLVIDDLTPAADKPLSWELTFHERTTYNPASLKETRDVPLYTEHTARPTPAHT